MRIMTGATSAIMARRLSAQAGLWWRTGAICTSVALSKRRGSAAPDMALDEAQGASRLIEIPPRAAARRSLLHHMIEIGLEALAVLGLVLQDHTLNLARQMAA